MKNKKVYILIALALIIIGYVFLKPKPTAEDDNVINTPVVTGNVADLVSLSVAPGESISGKFVLTGSIQNGYFFEANAIVKIMDMNKNVLYTTYASATTDWMTAGPITFSSDVDLTGLPTGDAYLVLENDNPSGLSENSKQIFVPVVIN